MDWSKPEVIMACFAAVISAGALATSIFSAKSSRRHNRSVLRPRLSFDFSIYPTYPFSLIVLANRGLGPAIVTKFEFMIDGQSLEDLGLTRFEQITQYLSLPENTVISVLTPPEPIAVNQKIELVAAPILEYTTELGDEIRDGFRRISYEVTYTSTDYGKQQFSESVLGIDIFPE